jgi:hypothetical protein
MMSLTRRHNILDLCSKGSQRESHGMFTLERKIEKLSSPDDMLSGSIATTRRSVLFSSYFLASLLSCASSADS